MKFFLVGLLFFTAVDATAANLICSVKTFDLVGNNLGSAEVLNTPIGVVGSEDIVKKDSVPGLPKLEYQIIAYPREDGSLTIIVQVKPKNSFRYPNLVRSQNFLHFSTNVDGGAATVNTDCSVN